MWNTKQILNQLRKKGTQLLRGVPEKKPRKPRVVINKQDTKLETPHRRHAGWGNIRKQRALTWDAVKVSRRMDRILQPATGKEEAERVREKEIRNGERAARLARLYHNEDFKFFWSIMMGWEMTALIDLTKPEQKKEGVTIDHYYGFMTGQLHILSNMKELMTRAVIKVKKNETVK